MDVSFRAAGIIVLVPYVLAAHWLGRTGRND
jgi:hypothetical protein